MITRVEDPLLSTPKPVETTVKSALKDRSRSSQPASLTFFQFRGLYFLRNYQLRQMAMFDPPSVDGI